MNRSQRVAVTAAAASALIAGAAGAVTLGPLGASGFAGTPPRAAGSIAQPSDGSTQAGRGSRLEVADLHAAVTRLTRAATALQAELAGAGHRLDPGTIAPGSAAARPAAGVATARAGQVRRAAPVVHARTGASSAAGGGENEAEND